MLTSNWQVAILMLNQSKVRNAFECLMVSLRIGERAIPVAWIVKKTEAEIGHTALINVGILHELGHLKLWYIAIDEKPSGARNLDYGIRWKIYVSREGSVRKIV